MIFSDRATNAAAKEQEPRRKSSLAKVFLPFRSSKKQSPNTSLNSSPRSSVDIDSAGDTKSRRFSLSYNPSNASTNSSNYSNGNNKLRKQSLMSNTSTNDTWEQDRVTGEVKDHTNMLHALANDFEAPTAGKTPIVNSSEPAQPATELVSTLPPQIWRRIISNLELADGASLSMSCKPFRTLCDPRILRSLHNPTNFRERCEFLYRLNYAFPQHLLCYICARFHLRTESGKETLRPTNVANPLYVCPYANSIEPSEKISRARITFGRHLPFSFVELATRHHHNGPEHGVPCEKLSRRYADKPEIGTWHHQTRYAMIEDHLYMRVMSFAFAQPNLPPSGMRHLLYSREDFTPFFSVCAHWRDGELMSACKCGLGHIPIPIDGGGVDRVAKEAVSRVQRPKSQIVSQCEKCKPLRRCPECPTEYLIEVRLQEDREEKDPLKLFKHAIVVTRWSDLGDGSTPWCPEWAAIQGDTDVLPDGERFDSFEKLGRRAISGTFESWFNPEQIPPQRLMSLNPGGERLGEKGHNWY